LIFIISWAGQHDNACFIADQIAKKHQNVAIVYSNPDPNFILTAPCQLIRRPNELFWADKFKACLDAVGQEGMLVIHADCHCTDWSQLVDRCKQVVERVDALGVWAPQIDGTYFHVNVTQMAKLKKNNLVLSALTDGIVFYLAPAIVDRMRQVDYETNQLGWGIDFLFCSYAHCIQKWVAIDLMIQVTHPKGVTGYDNQEARRQLDGFLNQFTLNERLQHQLLTTYVKYNYAKLRVKQNHPSSGKSSLPII
jgi:hypothetical protein